MSLNWELSDVFLIIRLGIGVLGRNNIWIKSHFYDIISRVHSINASTIVDVNLDHLPEVVFVKFLHCKVILFSIFHSVLFGMMSLCAPTRRVGVCSTSSLLEDGVYISYLEFFHMGDLSYFILFHSILFYFILSTFHLYQYGCKDISKYVFHILGYISYFFVAQTFPTLAIGISFH